MGKNFEEIALRRPKVGNALATLPLCLPPPIPMQLTEKHFDSEVQLRSWIKDEVRECAQSHGLTQYEKPHHENWRLDKYLYRFDEGRRYKQMECLKESWQKETAPVQEQQGPTVTVNKQFSLYGKLMKQCHKVIGSLQKCGS